MILWYKNHQNIFFVCITHVLMSLSDIKVKAFYDKKAKLEKNKIVPSVLYIHVSQYSVIFCHRITILHFYKLPLISKVSLRWLPWTHIRDLSP